MEYAGLMIHVNGVLECRENHKIIQTGRHTMEIERFVDECVTANNDSDPQAAVTEVLARAVSNSNAVLAVLGEPSEAGIKIIHRSETLTIFNATWTPQMNLMPHNHLMWASIGIYTGREDNIMWRRSDKHIEAFGVEALFAGNAAALPVDAIHSVTNPLLRFTGGIHIYGGDFFDTTRSQWNPETLDEEPSDGDVIRGIFERENQRNQAGRTG
jgi:predicted metal-dependent enzyme (double-stranded beta helix superfamily)